MFRFASPYFLLLGVFIPIAIFMKRKKNTRPLLWVGDVSPAKGINPSWIMRFASAISSMKYMALILVIIALARPQYGTQKINMFTEGINIILAIDLSESMAALDFKKDGKIINRLEAVKGVVEKFIQNRRGDRIGMVVFGTHAYTQLPLTRDYNTIVSILDRLKIGAAGKSTAIGDAIGISIKRLSDIPGKSNVIILLTDGRSNAGELSPEAAAGICAEKKIKIYTIGVGTRGKAPFLIKSPIFGERYVYQKVDIDENTLNEIAKKTGGLYFRAENTKGLEQIYKTIDNMEKTKVKVEKFAEYRELYLYFLIPAFFLLIFWIILSNTRFLRVP